MYKTQIKHKAMHGGYKQKPTKQSVNALMDMYGECLGQKTSIPQVGTQLKLDLCTNAPQHR